MAFFTNPRLRIWCGTAFGITQTAVVWGLKGTFILDLFPDWLIFVQESSGPSMLPTLNASGDWLVHMPLPFFRFVAPLLPRDVAPSFHDPKRTMQSIDKKKAIGGPMNKLDPAMGTGIAVGDLVVVCSYRDASYEACKRVVGLGGDTILVEPSSKVSEDHHLRWRIGKDKKSSNQQTDDESFASDDEPRYIVVPPGHAWIVGDNLSNSTDSRHYGPIPLGLIRGRVIGKVSVFLGECDRVFKLLSNRIFKLLSDRVFTT